jgi:cobalt-zinc-cadmium efflux system outer membrane protein
MQGLILREKIFQYFTGVLSISLLSLALIGWTEETPNELNKPLTLLQAYQIALNKNLTIKTKQAKVNETQADIDVAKIRPNPALTTDLSRAEETYRVIGIEQLFEVPGKRPLRIRIAKEAALEAQADYRRAVQNVLMQVRAAYMNWIVALIHAEIQTDNIDIAEGLKNIAEARFQAGNSTKLDVIQSDLLLNQAKNNILQAQSQVRQTQALLAGLLNTPSITAPEKPSMEVEQLYTTLPIDTVLQDSLKNRQDLQAKAKAIQVQQDRIHLYRLSIVPDLTLQAGYDVVTSQTSPTRHGIFTIGRVPFPIFDHQQGNLAKARATYQRLLTERALLEHQIRTDVMVNYEKVQSHQAQWENYLHVILPEAKEVETLAQQSYQAGKIDIRDALLTHQHTLLIRQQALQAFSDYQQAITDLESELGQIPGVSP